MKVKQIKVEDLSKILCELRYQLDDHITFVLYQVSDAWVVSQLIGGGCEHKIRLFDRSEAGGCFKTLEKAQKELCRILQFYITPVSDKNVLQHFDDKWIAKEEQPKELTSFRTAILNKQWQKAAKIYNKKFSRWTREAIPDIITFQISRNLTLMAKEKK